ncbi:hypothetical protein LT493_26240 [Streptomyces tricolor]|nr:hypothetical protein [Streptomyces tricolor]
MYEFGAHVVRGTRVVVGTDNDCPTPPERAGASAPGPPGRDRPWRARRRGLDTGWRGNGRSVGGAVAALDDGLAEQAHAVTQTVRETLGEWHSRPPVSNEAALAELLAYVARDVVAGT